MGRLGKYVTKVMIELSNVFQATKTIVGRTDDL